MLAIKELYFMCAHSTNRWEYQSNLVYVNLSLKNTNNFFWENLMLMILLLFELQMAIVKLRLGFIFQIKKYHWMVHTSQQDKISQMKQRLNNKWTNQSIKYGTMVHQKEGKKHFNSPFWCHEQKLQIGHHCLEQRRKQSQQYSKVYH